MVYLVTSKPLYASLSMTKELISQSQPNLLCL